MKLLRRLHTIWGLIGFLLFFALLLPFFLVPIYFTKRHRWTGKLNRIWAKGTLLFCFLGYRVRVEKTLDPARAYVFYTLSLSTFDGNHAYIFKAVKKDSMLQGDFWSGKTYHQSWTGIKNANASLPNAESLTSLKPGFETLTFNFPDLDGKNVSLTDERFKNKVVILQLFGTWCPKCMAETKYLSPWYDNNKTRGVEILGLAFERKPDFEYASERVKKMKAKWGVNYDFVIAGVHDKAKAAEVLPELNKVVAFPTTIFIGKDGKVKHIHTGF